MTPELEAWLTERLARERQATTDLVIKVVTCMLNEQIRRSGEACDLGFERLQNLISQMQALVEERARLDSATPVVDNSVN
jgi:hypothetical protein